MDLSVGQQKQVSSMRAKLETIYVGLVGEELLPASTKSNTMVFMPSSTTSDPKLALPAPCNPSSNCLTPEESFAFHQAQLTNISKSLIGEEPVLSSTNSDIKLDLPTTCTPSSSSTRREEICSLRPSAEIVERATNENITPKPARLWKDRAYMIDPATGEHETSSQDFLQQSNISTSKTQETENDVLQERLLVREMVKKAREQRRQSSFSSAAGNEHETNLPSGQADAQGAVVKGFDVFRHCNYDYGYSVSPDMSNEVPKNETDDKENLNQVLGQNLQIRTPQTKHKTFAVIEKCDTGLQISCPSKVLVQQLELIFSSWILAFPSPACHLHS